MKKRLLLISLLLIILAGFFVYRVKIKNRWLDLHKPSLPKEVSYQDVVATQNLGSLPENQPTNPNQQSPAYLHPKALAKEGNLAVPFTSQAPHSDWSELFKEACEEAAVLMVDWFYKNQIINPDYATEEIIKMVDWQQKKWGGHFDLTVEQTAVLIKEYLGYEKAEVITDPTVDEIKFQLAQNRPVIVPAAGRALGNPYFTQPGPIYHMLVIKGYTETQFITNDPGTKRGQDYLYDFETIMAAMHDWNETDINQGAKKILVIYPAP